MKLGVMDYIVAATTIERSFANAARLGFLGVEVGLSRASLHDPAQALLAELKAAAAAHSLAIPSLVLGEHNNGGIGSADPAVAQAAAADIRAAIGWAAALGAPVILVPFFFHGDLPDDAAFERTVAAFRELCPLAAEQQVALCYEGTLPAARIRAMAEQVGSPAFGCYFDLANVVWRGMDTATEIRGLAGLIRQVHMKETRIGPGDVPPGLGRVEYAASAAALRAIGYDGWLVLETPRALPDLVARDVSFTRRIFPQAAWNGPDWPQFGAFTNDFGHGELDRMIAGFKAAGLTAVQLSGDLLASAVENEVRAHETAQRLTAAGIKVVGLAGYRNLIAPNAEQRAANLAFLKRCLAFAPIFGASVVATETGTRHPTSDWLATPENWDHAAWELLCAAIEELLPVAEQHGSILALEGYVNNIVQTLGQLQGLLERYPSRHLQVVCDPYNYLSSHLLPVAEETARNFFAQFEHRFVLAHLKDVAASGAEHDTPEFGTGVFPQQMYIHWLREHRPDLPLILEHLPWEHIPDAILQVRTLAG